MIKPPGHTPSPSFPARTRRPRAQGRLKEALRLSECPRTARLLDRCLLETNAESLSRASKAAGGVPTAASAGAPDSPGIPVSSLLSFMGGGFHSGGRLPGERPPRSPDKAGAKPAPAPAAALAPAPSPAPAPAWTLPPAIASQESSLPCPGRHAPPEDGSSDPNVSPRVIPVASRWVTHGGALDADSLAGTDSPGGGQQQGRARSSPSIYRENAGEGPHGHCTVLVSRPGTALAARPSSDGTGPGRRGTATQPVWRKKETLIQERIVQYTTLDEEGTVRHGRGGLDARAAGSVPRDPGPVTSRGEHGRAELGP